MKYTILAATALIGLACSSQSQTIKSLGFNTTNGEVVYSSTNTLRFTNAVTRFNNNIVIDGTVESSNFFVVDGTNGISFETTDVAALTRTNLGLGGTNSVQFRRLKMTATEAQDGGDDATLWLDTSGTNKFASIRLSGTGGSAEKYNAFLQGGPSGLSVTSGNGFKVLSGPSISTGAQLFAVNSAGNTTMSGTLTPAGNATLNGVNNTMPNATTADSASSLMTRGLSDDRYGDFRNTTEINNFTGAAIGGFSGGVVTISPSVVQMRADSGGGFRSFRTFYNATLTNNFGRVDAGAKSMRTIFTHTGDSRILAGVYPMLGGVGSQWAGRGNGFAGGASGVLPYFLYRDDAWRAMKATVVRGSTSVFPVRSNNIITIECNGAHNLTTNDFVSVASVFPLSMQTYRAAVLSVPTTNSFTYANTGADETGSNAAALGDSMSINKIEELGSQSVAVTTNNLFTGRLTHEFRIDYDAAGQVDFIINGTNIATASGFTAISFSGAQVGYGIQSLTNATGISDMHIYKFRYTINP